MAAFSCEGYARPETVYADSRTSNANTKMTPMSIAKSSWSAFDPEIAKVYLDGYGHPSERSKYLMSSVLAEHYGNRSFHLADFGCGNGHLYGFFKHRGLSLRYSGYDFSTSLLQAAQERYLGDDRAAFLERDIQDSELEGEPADLVLYSHVFETLESPGASLAAARRLASTVMIRFFEPPTDRYDRAELRMMDVGLEKPPVPYLRRSFSLDFYELLLTRAGCLSIDVHQVDGDKDEVHLLTF